MTSRLHHSAFLIARPLLLPFILLHSSFILSPAAPPPELNVLSQQYEKALATTVTGPFQQAVSALNAKYTGGLDRAIADAKAAGKLQDILAIEAEKKRLADNTPIPAEDDESTPAALKKLRGIYREQMAKIEETRATGQLPLVTALVERLKTLETTLTKADRVDEAKEVLAYREALAAGQPPAEAPPAAVAAAPGKPSTPAPFSPHRAWISPSRRSKLTSRSATTPGKLLVIEWAARMAWLMPAMMAAGHDRKSFFCALHFCIVLSPDRTWFCGIQVLSDAAARNQSPAMPEFSPAPGPTPSGYQRTTGGKFRWQPPPVEKLQSLLTGYEVISLIGHGGMGAVYRARQKSLDRLVAIKILPPEAAEDDATFVERFKNEARTMAKLNHPGIVHVHDFGETSDGQLYFVMEFVEGTDVQQMLLDHRVLTPEYALPITAHVCDALQYAHAQGVVHRDIKPANIMLTSAGQVKVADFGLAKLDDPASGSLTQANMSMGTPDYVAPETLTIGMTPDGRADLYALGVMLYHMLVGEVPRGAFDLPSKRNAALDPRIDAVILRSMKQNRDERYQSAAELRADVDAILSTPQVTSGGEPSAAIPKQAVAKARASTRPQTPAQKPASRSAPVKPANRSSPVKPVKKQTSAVTPVSPAKAAADVTGEAKPRNLAWVVPTGISAVVIIGGAFLMRGQRQKDIAPEARQAVSPAALVPSKPIKVIDHKPNSSEPTPPKLTDDKWTRFDPASDFALVKSGVTEKAGAFTIAGGQGRRLRTNWPHEDIAVRARITVPKDGVGFIGLRGDYQKNGVRAVVRPSGIVIEREIFDGGTERAEVLKEFAGVSSPFFEAKGAVLTFSTQGEDLNVWVDGKRLGAVTEPLPVYKGKILFDGKDATFSNIEWQVLGNSRQPDRKAANEFATLKLEPGKWTRVLFPDNKPPKGELRDGALYLPKREQCRLPAVFAARDAAIRAKISTTSGDGSYKGLYFKLRNDNALGFFNLGNSKTAHVGVQPDMSKDLVMLASSKDGAFPLGKKDLLVEFAVVGDDLILAIEGKTMATARSKEQPTGNRTKAPFLALIQAGWNEAALRDLEFMSLDGALPSTYPEFIKVALAAPVASSPPPAPSTPGVASVPASPAPPPPSNAPKLPAELHTLQSSYAAAIAERVTGPHDASVKQLNAGFTAALDRAVAARQLGADSIAADKKAVESKASLPPDLDTTPDALKTLRATYRTKIAEIDDTRTTAHLGLLTPYIAKLKQLEADLTKAARIPDAETVKSYRESLGENPFAMPSARP